MKKRSFEFLFALLMVLVSGQVVIGANGPISEDTEACIECHSSVSPGIVADWKKSRMAMVTPRQATARCGHWLR
jgi:hypothetical protein